MHPLPACLAALIALAACTEPYPLAPELAASGADAPYPELVPVEWIAAQVPPATDDRTIPARTEAIDSRAARLRARAERLRDPVIDPDTKTRMREGVDG
jgi:hypothetical protein